MLTKTWSVALTGINPFTVEIEVSAGGDSNDNVVQIVGLPDATVRESKDRIRSAMLASYLGLLKGYATVALAPADVKKSGAALDFPIAVGLIGTIKKLNEEFLEKSMFIGELALDGTIRPVRGALAMAIHARESGFRRLFVPAENSVEASIAEGVDIIPVTCLREAYEILTGQISPTPVRSNISEYFKVAEAFKSDFAHVKGQHAVKRGMEIAAAGAHNLLMIGPPGCGKSLLAKSYPSILPQLNLDEALKVTQIHSIAGTLPKDQPLVTERPFRSPHHTISDAGLLGGTSNPRPGEVSLAHKGVLFLDELPEYKRSTLEVMRQPLESGEVTISRANGTATFPAEFMLLAAMNPCPCGHYGSTQRECRCSSVQITRYRSKISGPLLDRIDIHLEVSPLTDNELLNKAEGEKSAVIRARVEKARAIQKERFGSGFRTNAMMGPKEIEQYCATEVSAMNLLRTAINNLNLSARAYDRILRLARTIADLDGQEKILTHHVAEAIQYRTLDRKLW